MAFKSALIAELILKNLVLTVTFLSPQQKFLKWEDSQPNATKQCSSLLFLFL